MIFLRTWIVVLITLALTFVPASVGASAAGMAASAASATSGCSPPCPMSGQMAGEMADHMADVIMPGGCHDTDGKGAPLSPSACAALCGGLVVALPYNSFVVAGAIAGKLPQPGTQTALAGRMDRPDLPPPRS